GIADRCTWLGAQPQKAVFAALARADLFVLAAKKAADGDQDGLPNVLMEAAHQGLPIISTRAAAIGEFIDHGNNGLLTSPGAPDELAEAMTRLARDPELRLQLARRAGETVRTRFSYEAGVDWIATALGQAGISGAARTEDLISEALRSQAPKSQGRAGGRNKRRVLPHPPKAPARPRPPGDPRAGAASARALVGRGPGV